MNIIKRLFCKHKYEFVRNIFGDEINYTNYRSIWKCSKCGKIKYSKTLHYEPFHDLNGDNFFYPIDFKIN